jgi:hypothetical protein
MEKGQDDTQYRTMNYQWWWWNDEDKSYLRMLSYMIFRHVIMLVTSVRLRQWLVSSSSVNVILRRSLLSIFLWGIYDAEVENYHDLQVEMQRLIIFFDFFSFVKDVLDFLNDFDWEFAVIDMWDMMQLRVIMWLSDESIVIISIVMIVFISWFSLSDIMSFKIVVIMTSSTKFSNVELKFIRFFSNISIDQTTVFFSARNRFSAKMYSHTLRSNIHFLIFVRYFSTIAAFSFCDDHVDLSLLFLFAEMFEILSVSIHQFS